MECIRLPDGLAVFARMIASRAGWEEAARAVEILVRELEYTGWGLHAELDAVEMVVCIEEAGPTSSSHDSAAISLPV